VDRTIADGGGIPLPVTGCGRRMRLSTSSSSSRDQSRDKTSLTSLTSLTLTAQGFHEWRYVPNNATHTPKTPLKRHGRPIAPRLANNATQAPRPWDGTTNYVSLLPGREMGSPTATVAPSGVLPTARQSPAGWILPPANTSGGWSCWRSCKGCWAKSNRCRAWGVCLR